MIWLIDFRIGENPLNSIFARSAFTIFCANVFLLYVFLLGDLVRISKVLLFHGVCSTLAGKKSSIMVGLPSFFKGVRTTAKF